jgi:endonuclease YncB( thermonuclease family)
MRIPLFFVLAVALLSNIHWAAAETLTGAVKVIDAATLSVGGRIVRLHGITAPAPADVCPFREKTIPCGETATTALMDLTAGASVSCETRGHADGTTYATCIAGGYDLSEGMVYTGWARPVAGAPARYLAAQDRARARNNGLWQGRFPAAVDTAAKQ